jgi:hypothetical protein
MNQLNKIKNQNEIRVMNKKIMKRINDKGIKRGYNQLICEDFLDNLEDKTFPIIGSFETEVFETKEKINRCIVVVDDEGLTVNLDMTQHQYDILPKRPR